MKTKGATSHIDVPLSVLVEQLPSTAKVRVARRWANTMGIDGTKVAQPEAPKTVAIQVDEDDSKDKLDIGIDNW